MTKTSPTNQSIPHAGRRNATRLGKPARLVLIGATVLSVAAAGIVGPAFSQAPAEQGREWGEHHRGWMSGGGMHREGHHDGYGPFGYHRSGPGAGHGWGGGMMFGPGSVERMVNRLARATDASSEQRQKMNAIAQSAAEEVMGLRQRHRAGREQLRTLLTAPGIDRAKLETLRVEQMKLADEASKRITVAIADIAEVLTPAQREELGRMLERRRGRRL